MPGKFGRRERAGADAFLLIAAILKDETLRELLELGRSLKMEPWSRCTRAKNSPA